MIEEYQETQRDVFSSERSILTSADQRYFEEVGGLQLEQRF